MGTKRGEFGYIKARKKRMLLGVLLMLLCGIALFVIGLLLNKMSNRNIFTVLAVLCVLPGTRFLVGLIVVFPYRSISKERYEKAKKATPEGVSLYTDLVVTSSEKIMLLDFAAIGYGQVVILSGQQKKQDLPYIKKYITQGVHNWGTDYKVKIVENEKMFLRELAAVSPKEVDEEEEEHVKSYLTTLIV